MLELAAPERWATYRELHLTISGASIDTASRGVGLRVSTNSGSSFASSGYGGVRLTAGGGVDDTTAYLFAETNFGTAAQTANIKAVITGHQGGTYVSCSAAGVGSLGQGLAYQGAYFGSTSAINALQILVVGTGNFDAGTYQLTGIR